MSFGVLTAIKRKHLGRGPSDESLASNCNLNLSHHQLSHLTYDGVTVMDEICDGVTVMDVIWPRQEETILTVRPPP